MLSDTKFRDATHVANISQRIASSIGRRIDESSPMVDARLKDGSRVNIVFPPLALDGPYISIRKFSRQQIDFAKLIGFGSLTAPVARVLEIAGRCRLNVIISGGTGSGKTTLMNAMSRLIDAGERIVTIEDAAELQLQQPHVVRLETRPSSLEGRGEVTQRDLIHNALRMRPDRIIVGEVRGSEAFDMLQAMNTGHDGSMSTVHANTTRDAVTRIENMVQMGNMGLPARSIRAQFVGAVDLIVQVERHRDGKRRVTQVTDVCGLEGDTVILNDIFAYHVDGETMAGGLVGSTASIARGRVFMRACPISASTAPGPRRWRKPNHEGAAEPAADGRRAGVGRGGHRRQRDPARTAAAAAFPRPDGAGGGGLQPGRRAGGHGTRQHGPVRAGD